MTSPAQIISAVHARRAPMMHAVPASPRRRPVGPTMPSHGPAKLSPRNPRNWRSPQGRPQPTGCGRLDAKRAARPLPPGPVASHHGSCSSDTTTPRTPDDLHDRNARQSSRVGSTAAGRCAWAIGAARDSGVGAVRRDLGTSMDARPDCCMDQGASTEAAGTRCAVLARNMSLAKSGSDRHVRSCLRGYSRVTALASASMPDSRAVQGTGRLGCSPNGNGAGHG